MSTINTSNSSNLRLYQQLIAMNRDNYNNLAQKISAGSNYLKRSDDAAQTNRAALVDIDESQKSQWARNVSLAKNWETASYSYLDDIASTMKSALAVTTEANNTVDQVAGWSSLSKELDGIIESVVSDANSTYMGISIFAGTDTSSTVDAYTVTKDADGSITTVTYNGNDSKRSVQISPTTSTEYGLPGSTVFTTSVTYPSGTSNSYDTIQSLLDLRDYLKSGGNLSAAKLAEFQTRYSVDGDTPTAPTIFTRILGAIQAGSNTISDNLAANSSSSARLDSLDSTITSAIAVDETQYSEIMQIDTAKAATDLATYSSSLQASLQLASNLTKYSLINYI